MEKLLSSELVSQLVQVVVADVIVDSHTCRLSQGGYLLPEVGQATNRWLWLLAIRDVSGFTVHASRYSSRKTMTS